MLKIHRFNCAGLDVHKNLIVATIGITDKKTRVTEYIQKDFSSLNYDLYNLKNWLIEHKCFDVCMESTGKYWIKLSKAKKQTRKIPNGFVIFSNMIFSNHLLSHLRIFVN